MIAWAIETFAATTLLMLLVLAVRAPMRRAFGPTVVYALWLLPVARMLLPPLPQQWREQAVVPVSAANDIIAYYVVEPISLSAKPSATAVSSSIDWIFVTLLAWIVGAALFLAYHLIAHRLHCRRLLRSARVDRTVAQGKVRVIETDAAHGPLAFGVFRKYVAFPRDFAERYDEQERDLALAHELGHHARGDLLANWVALVVLALHWFNPVAWRAFRAFRADQEMACDALVLAGRAQALRHAYGRAIVKSAHGGAVSAACHLHTINEVKGRLRMLSKTHLNSPTRIAAGLAGVALVGLGALGLTASGTQAAERIKGKVEAVTGMTLDQSIPAPPAAPAGPAPAEAPAAPEAPEPARPGTRQVYRFTSDKDGEQVKKVVVVHADGTKTETEVPELAAIEANIPEVRDGKCGKGDETVVHRHDAGKRVMIICTDRIAAMTANATRMAMDAKRMGLDGARMGIEAARRSIQSDRKISAADRAEALKELDEAIVEIERDAADPD